MIIELNGKLNNIDKHFIDVKVYNNECYYKIYRLLLIYKDYILLKETFEKDKLISLHVFEFFKDVNNKFEHTMYGFLNIDDKNTFEKLLKISGVGTKIAGAIISTYSLNELKQIVLDNNIKLLSKTPGIGLKTSEKLILELKSIFNNEKEPSFKISDSKNIIDNYKEDIILGLISLGYNRKNILLKINLLDKPFNSVSDGIKIMLKLLNT